MEKSKEATDLANIRSAYAEVMSAGLTDTGTTHDASLTNITRTGSAGSFTWTATVDLKQSVDGWDGAADDVGGVDVSGMTPKAGGTCTISFTEGDANADIAFST